MLPVGCVQLLVILLILNLTIKPRHMQTQLNERVEELISRISLELFGKHFFITCSRDKKRPKDGRWYIQLVYEDECNKTGELETWTGRKYYLSEHMIDDEIVKTIWCAFERCVHHEVMEGFKVDGTILFNPHVDFETLLDVSQKEVLRA